MWAISHYVHNCLLAARPGGESAAARAEEVVVKAAALVGRSSHVKPLTKYCSSFVAEDGLTFIAPSSTSPIHSAREQANYTSVSGGIFRATHVALKAQVPQKTPSTSCS